MTARKTDLEHLVHRIVQGIDAMGKERDESRAEGNLGRASTKQAAMDDAKDYAEELLAKLDAMPEGPVSTALYEEAEKVALASEMGGILIDSRPTAERHANDPSHQIWDDGAEKRDWAAGTHDAQTKAKEVEASGRFGHVAGEINGVVQVPFWQLGARGQVDAEQAHQQEVNQVADEHQTAEPYWQGRADEHRNSNLYDLGLDNDITPEATTEESDEQQRQEASGLTPEEWAASPTNAAADYTSEQEERAAGVPSAQPADYSEEPLDEATTSYDDEAWSVDPTPVNQFEGIGWGVDQYGPASYPQSGYAGYRDDYTRPGVVEALGDDYEASA